MARLLRRRRRLASTIAILRGAAKFWRRPTEGYEKYVPMDAKEGPQERAVRQALSDTSANAEIRYELLFQYFLHGFITFATQDFERIHYPGMASVRGYRISGLEGFSRTAPLMAAWIYSGRATIITDRYDGSRIDLVKCLKKAMLAGTNPSSPTYWGTITNRDQRTVEAADIARVLWLTRDHIWKDFSAAERKQVADWLLQVNGVEVVPNNWQQLSVVVNFALNALGYERARDDPRYDQFKANYLGHGWYFDKPHGVDYYNAWGITYDLLWIHLLRPDFDRDFIRDALAQSASLTSHLIGPKGIPILGRSVCYRTAVPVPLIAVTFIDDSPITHGRARRAMDVIWRYFVAHDSLRNSTLTQGYFDNDPRFVERYIGAGSCHWGLRSLVLALMHAPATGFWTDPDAPLPVEVADYRLDLPELGWIVQGRKETGEITITIPHNAVSVIEPEPYSVLRQWIEKITRHPMRPANMDVKYNALEYSSLRPFPLLWSRD